MTTTLTSNRVADRAAHIRRTMAAGTLGGGIDTARKLAVFEEAMALTWSEHYAYQNAQAIAFASGRLTQDEAMLVYNALGEVGSAKNGGWAAGTDLATKVAVTQLMAQLLREH